MRILAIDDDVIILEILDIFLSSFARNEVVYVTSGIAALQAIKQSEKPFDCILLDLNMPGMMGIDLIPLIRKTQGYQFIPIIMLTALDDRRYISEAFVAGAWDYIVKPFEMLELEARIHSAELRNAEFNRLLRQIEDMPAPCASDACQIGNMSATQTGLVSTPVFQTCLSRIVNAPGPSLGLFKIGIEDFETLSTQIEPRLMDAYVNTLAHHLLQELADKHGIITYLGDGMFGILSFILGGDDGRTAIEASKRAADAVDKAFFKAQDLVTRLWVVALSDQEIADETGPYCLNWTLDRLEPMSVPTGCRQVTG